MSSAAEATANSLMAIFGFKPSFKVYAQEEGWMVAKRVESDWAPLSGPWPSEEAALDAVPGRQ